MLLHDKTAVIYGAGGAVGAAVAHAFANDGATVFLAGRTPDKVEAVAADIRAAGGAAEAAQVDAFDEQAVDAHTAEVVARAGRIDVLFNAIGLDDVQGTPLLDMSLDDLAHPVIAATKSHFLTARSVGRRMVEQGGGVLMSITAEPTAGPNLGGFPAACSLIETLWRSFAVELGPHGVRTVVIRSAGSPDSPAVQYVYALHTGAAAQSVDEIQANWGSTALLGRWPLLADVANAAVLLASDRAAAMTATHANVTCGAHVDG